MRSTARISDGVAGTDATGKPGAAGGGEVADRAGGVRTRSCGDSSATTAAAEGVGAGVE